jgi:hypothetical protein
MSGSDSIRVPIVVDVLKGCRCYIIMLHEFCGAAIATSARFLQGTRGSEQHAIKQGGDGQNTSNNCTRSRKTVSEHFESARDGLGTYDVRK